ncbi:MAG TPA: glycoside hydrolase family 43 protein, partial [Polyangiaceae bacterium]
MRKPGRHYTNPILTGFHPDPSICRAGDDYYLVTSSFEYFPGIPIFHSRDLVHFHQIGHVLTRKSQLPLDGVRSSGGLYAPTIRYHHGKFYVVCTNMHLQRNFIVRARRPQGPWSEPLWIDREGFDPSLFFDDTGEVYFTRDGQGADFDHPQIFQAKIDVSTGKLRNRPKSIFTGTGGIWPEASHIYRRGDWHYLVIAEGGTSYGHSAVVARSRKPTGPFEACPYNPLMTHANRPRDPFQALGHADLVDTPTGETFAVLLGIRPTHGRYHH